MRYYIAEAALISTVFINILGASSPPVGDYYVDDMSLDGNRGRRRQRSIETVTVPWPNGIVYYEIQASSGYSQTQKDNMRQAMDTIEAISCVRFVESPTEHIKVLIRSVDGFCHASIGKRYKGYNYLKLDKHSPTCTWLQSNLLHELMHILGFMHEHQRPDRDKYVTVNCANMHGGCTSAERKRGSLQYDTPYDYRSIMHYDRKVKAINKGIDTYAPTEEWVKQGSPVYGPYPWRTLSALDKARINQVYNCPEPSTAPPFTPLCGYIVLLDKHPPRLQAFDGNSVESVATDWNSYVSSAPDVAIIGDLIYIVRPNDFDTINVKTGTVEKMKVKLGLNIDAFGATYNTLYACGKPNNEPSTQCFEYIPGVSTQWTPLTDLSDSAIKLNQSVQSLVFDDRLHILGGYSSKQHVSIGHRGDVRLHADMNHVRYDGSGVAELDRQLYICGGLDTRQTLSSCERWNSNLDEWSYASSMNQASMKGKLYAFGGDRYGTIEQYDSSTDQWTDIDATLTTASTTMAALHVPV